MVSGKYSALAGAVTRNQAIANISNNLANVNTAGFKRKSVSFESLLEAKQQVTNAQGINYTRISENKTDFSQGPLKHTENPYDLSIQGKGFFKLKGPEGDLYTRRGDFGIRGDGVLTTSHGLPVLSEGGGEIIIPDAQGSKVAFGEEGTIYLLGEQGLREQVGKLGIYDVADETTLKNESDTTFSLTDGGEEIDTNDFRIVQGSLEIANVNMIKSMTDLIANQRAYDTLHKTIKSYSSISEQYEKLGKLS
ncbi:MAG: flagellar basal-body rod protein FlgF [Desulfotalea sp.]